MVNWEWLLIHSVLQILARDPLGDCWSALARAVQLVHVTHVQCPGMLPDINLLVQKQSIIVLPLYFQYNFNLQNGGVPRPLVSSSDDCQIPLAFPLTDTTIFRAALLDNQSNTTRVQYPSREPARPSGVLVCPYSEHEAFPLIILSLAIIYHVILEKLFNIPASPPHPQSISYPCAYPYSLFSRQYHYLIFVLQQHLG